jgi:hypothetical protein
MRFCLNVMCMTSLNELKIFFFTFSRKELFSSEPCQHLVCDLNRECGWNFPEQRNLELFTMSIIDSLAITMKGNQPSVSLFTLSTYVNQYFKKKWRVTIKLNRKCLNILSNAIIFRCDLMRPFREIGGEKCYPNTMAIVIQKPAILPK